MAKPAYIDGSIVNLMSSILQGLGTRDNQHPPLNFLDKQHFKRAKNTVLLVIDGLGYNYLVNKAPNSTLCKYLHGHLTTVFPSTTATAITTFMTGAAPQQHGLTGWFTYFQELESILAVLPVRYRYCRSGSQDFNIDVEKLYGHVPVFDLLDVNGYIVTPRDIAFSSYSLAHRGKATIKPYDNLQECFSFTRDIINEDPAKKYIYTYWPMFDGMSHEKGVGSHEVAQHFLEIDKAFDKFIEDIKGTDTLLIVTADHGIVDSGPDYCVELENHPDLQDMLALPFSGERRMAYCYVKPDQHENFTAYITQNLNDKIVVHQSSTLLGEHYFGLGNAHEQLHNRIGDFILEMKENFTIMDTLINENHFYHIGTHGGLSDEEMQVPLIVLEL